MRKLFTFIAASAMVLGASAQGYEGNKFFDNWSIGIEGGATTAIRPIKQPQGTNKAFQKKAFFKGVVPVAGVEITKQIIPAFGLAIQDHAIFNWTDSKTSIDVNDLVLLGKVNFMNLFGGYKGKPRTFELEGVFGGGWRRYMAHNVNYVGNGPKTGDASRMVFAPQGCKDRDDVIMKAGLNLLFNLGSKNAWTLAIKPAVVWDLEGFAYEEQNCTAIDIHNANFELTAGIAYHFKNSNGAHHFTKVRPYDQAEVDDLNGRINALRGELADKDGVIAQLNDEIEALRNRKPQVIEKIVEKEKIVNGKDVNTLENNVFFKIGKSVIGADQVPNVERVASFLKSHKDAKVVVKGYASKDGNEAFNIKLAENRAKAVKNMLIKKYGIAADRIDAAGNGISEMFEEAEWNRVSVCTINK